MHFNMAAVFTAVLLQPTQQSKDKSKNRICFSQTRAVLLFDVLHQTVTCMGFQHNRKHRRRRDLFLCFMMPLHQNVESCVFSLVSLLRLKAATEHLETERQRVRDGVRERPGNVVAIVTIWWVGTVSPWHSFHHIEPLSLVLSSHLQSHLCLSLSFSSISPALLSLHLVLFFFIFIFFFFFSPPASPPRSRVECRVVLPSLSSWPSVHFYYPALTDPSVKLETCQIRTMREDSSDRIYRADLQFIEKAGLQSEETLLKG